MINVSFLRSHPIFIWMCQRRQKMGWILGTGTIIGAMVAYANYSWYKTEKMPYEHIANAEINALDGSEKVIRGQDLWSGKNGAVIMVVRRAG